MTNPSTIHSKPYRNWVRGTLGVLYVHEGLYPFTDRVVKAEHERILKHLTHCNSCMIDSIQPAHARKQRCIHKTKAKCNCRKNSNKECNTCGHIYDSIIKQHRFRDPLWVTNTTTWYTDHWQIAKCFMTTSTLRSNNTASETDAAGLLRIIINGLFFTSEIDNLSCLEKVRDIRNTILHNSTLELSDTDVTDYLRAMISVLEDPKTLLNDPSAQAAVKKLKEIINDELVITTKEEARANKTALDAIKDAREQSEESLRKLTETEENRIKKTAKTSEESFKKLTEEKQNTLKDQASEAENKIKSEKKEAITEVRSTVSSVIEEDYKPEVMQLKLKHDDHEQRLKVMEKKQTDIREKQSSLQKQLSLLSIAERKHQTMIDYLEQKQDLRLHIVDLYQKHYVKTWTSPLMQQANDIDITDVYVSQDMVVEEKYGEIKHINRYHEMFHSDDRRNKRIYVVGDVGTGKSAFCKMMMQNWCQTVTGKRQNREQDLTDSQKVEAENNDNNIRDISAFDFLFYVPLQIMSEYSHDIFEMVKAQFNEYRFLLDKIYSNESEYCLILADGLDEWTPPKKSEPCLPHVTYGLPTLRLASDATLITTSRPSARGLLNMKSSECDLKVNLFGINELGSFIEKYMERLVGSPPAIDDFLKNLGKAGLNNLQKTPMLLQQIIWMYCKGHEIGKSVSYIYTDILNIILGWSCVESGTRPLVYNFRNALDDTLSLPCIFKKYPRCQESRDLIMLLGKIAYDSIVSSVVLDRNRFKKFGLTDEDIATVLMLGILKEENCDDPTYVKSQILFVHTSYQAFLAAVYISSQTTPRTLIRNIIERQTSAIELIRLKNLLTMLCGLLPSRTSDICECIYQVASRDEEMVKKRNDPTSTRFNEIAKEIQDTCIQCVSECSSTDPNVQPIIKLCDLSLHTFYDDFDVKYLHCVESKSLLTCCISHKTLSNEMCTSLSSFLSQAVSLRTLQLCNIRCTCAQRDGHSINVSQCAQLHSLCLNNCTKIAMSSDGPLTSLVSCQISNFNLSHELCKSLSSFLSHSVSIETLALSNIRCEGTECDSHSIDLSNNTQLQNLKLYCCNQIYVSSERPLTSLVSCQISNSNLSHELCKLLSSFLLQAVSLETLTLGNIKCKRAECDGHIIDLFKCTLLQKLHLYSCNKISVCGVNSLTSLVSCQISIYNLSHEMCTLLSSFLSQAVSLETLTLSNIRCTCTKCDGHSIDLTNHAKLQSLYLYRCNQIFVSGLGTLTKLVSCKIYVYNLSHELCTSLSTFLSNAISLETLLLSDIKCTRADCDGHRIDVSLHAQLHSLYLNKCNQISVSGGRPDTILGSCQIIDCTLSHNLFTSLSLFLSQAVSLETLTLHSIICTCAECDDRSINVSDLARLQSLYLYNCTQISVFCAGFLPSLVSCQISECNLSHELCKSLSSFLSNAISIKTLKLCYITCTGTECDGHSIDVFRHTQLHSLELSSCNQISVSCGGPITCLESCEIFCCHFPHKLCTSLSLFLSQAVSLKTLSLYNIRCTRAECDGHSIDLSDNAQLQDLKLYYCKDISVSGTGHLTSFVSSRISDCYLSHEMCTSLLSFLSQAVSFKRLTLSNISCTDAECCGHEINFSRYAQLQSLELYRCNLISVSSVTPLTSLVSCEISDCDLSHEQCISLSSLLSKTVSLEDLELCRNRCTSSECDDHSIDVSHHEQLKIRVRNLCLV